MKVKITEAKNYGGAFDIDPESYFTRDDLNEFGYAVEDAIKENDSLKDMDIVYNSAWVDGNTLTFAVMDNDGNEVKVQEKIDFRKIKIPSDLIKVYLSDVVSKVCNEFLDIYSDYLNEAQQAGNQLKELQKKHRKTIKKGAQGYFTTLNSGNPEVSMNVFNASANGVSSPVGESLDEALKNTYEVQYLPYRTDNIVTTYIDAYSEKQAALILRKTTKGIRRIVSILCIKDRSEEEGEQLKLFEANGDRGIAELKEFICDLLNLFCNYYLNANDFVLHHKNGNHSQNNVRNIILLPNYIDVKPGRSKRNLNTTLHNYYNNGNIKNSFTSWNLTDKKYKDHLVDMNGVDVYKSLAAGELVDVSGSPLKGRI